jgi:hypothetical protein
MRLPISSPWNNCYSDYAVRNARQMADIFSETLIAPLPAGQA